MTNVPGITEPAEEPEDHRPDVDAQIRELSSRAVASLPRYQPMSLAKVSPAIEEMMRNILAHQRLNLGDQLNSAVVSQLFENSSALKVARESLSDLVSGTSRRADGLLHWSTSPLSQQRSHRPTRSCTRRLNSMNPKT